MILEGVVAELHVLDHPAGHVLMVVRGRDLKTGDSRRAEVVLALEAARQVEVGYPIKIDTGDLPPDGYVIAAPRTFQ